MLLIKSGGIGLIRVHTGGGLGLRWEYEGGLYRGNTNEDKSVVVEQQ